MGTPPPSSLAPHPISYAVLDSRDVETDALFIAFMGRHTDGHKFVRQAVVGGAAAIICEERGIEQLHETNALIIDCRKTPLASGQWSVIHEIPLATDMQFAPGRTLAYIVPDSNTALQAVGVFQRLHRTRPDLRVTGVTGSIGKTSTKELATSVLGQHYATHHSPGNLNSEQGLPLTLLGLRPDHEQVVLEMGMYNLGEIRFLCSLARPQIGIVTNVGPSHLERLGTIDRTAKAKAELVEALPSARNGGVAILNWDDERVRAMQARTDAQVFFYGLTHEADLWADEIESLGMEGIRFRFHHRQANGRIHRLYLKVPLLGRHSVHTALRAAALGIVNDLAWQEIASGLQRMSGQLRLVVVAGLNGSTVIDDTYNASPNSTLAALNLLNDLHKHQQREIRKTTNHSQQATRFRRRIAVLGDMRELGNFTVEGHKQVGIRAAAVADVLVTVGELGQIIADEAQRAGLSTQAIYATDDFKRAVQILKELLQPQDLLLVKGSRDVGMDRIVTEISDKV